MNTISAEQLYEIIGTDLISAFERRRGREFFCGRLYHSNGDSTIAYIQGDTFCDLGSTLFHFEESAKYEDEIRYICNRHGVVRNGREFSKKIGDNPKESLLDFFHAMTRISDLSWMRDK